MDKLSFLGLLLAFSALALGYYLEGGMVSHLVNFPALIIVMGGTLGAVMLQSRSLHFIQAIKMLAWVIFKPDNQIDQGVRTVRKWSTVARQEGFLALESHGQILDDHLISTGISLLIDGTEGEHLRDALDTELVLYRDSLLKSAKVYESMGGYSPTIGIIGAVLGLIQAMSSITDPDALGAGIATAFVATIYGVGFANLVFLPIADKLKESVNQQLLYKEMMVEGLVAISVGENPSNIELRLAAYKVDKYTRL